MKNWVSYQNGNYTVRLNTENGTKIRENDLSFFDAEFPESADVKITNKCSNGCTFCFIPGTEVVLNDGSNIAIENVKIGNKVFSYNFEKKEKEIKEVKRTFEHLFEGDLIKLTLENGDVIKCTPNHKIYTVNRGYVEAKDLTEMDEVNVY